ncbi:succinylglutamate desuccinylase [Brumicola nitratireducens]|uniref:Succinylglutamate desuccinylase n=1 Tax=Glaciecola nitratireducens (strain JCM 12485 / KCTC 12276 / FR1064) TaxID=1085623 RepID=G4QHB7_GLANF|nr:succinylglutamate desuccinylase [Glaciecola nitratireducens]AEP29748.1 succinylglutamate desuccinylase [Glaciecola nitratireducens FR1064]
MSTNPISFLAQSRFSPETIQAQQRFQLSNGTTVETCCPGVITFEPASLHAAKSILLSSGVHGNETAPIEICEALVEDLLQEKIKTQHRVMFIFGNLPAMNIGERFVEENLNRLFNASVSIDNQEQVRAQELKREVHRFFESDSAAPSSHSDSKRIHYDLHTAIRESKNEKFVVYPFLHGHEYSKQQLRFLSACDVNTVLLSQSPTSTFSYYTSRNYNTHGFTVELGKVKPFGENNMASFRNVNEMLTQLITRQEPILPPLDECPLDVFDVKQVIDKHTDDFKLHFADNIPNFTGFPKGTLLATDGDKEYRALENDEAIVFPNANVALGQRALLTVVRCEI